jgi:hypothetical protein
MGHPCRQAHLGERDNSAVRAYWNGQQRQCRVLAARAASRRKSIKPAVDQRVKPASPRPIPNGARFGIGRNQSRPSARAGVGRVGWVSSQWVMAPGSNGREMT